MVVFVMMVKVTNRGFGDRGGSGGDGDRGGGGGVVVCGGDGF